MVIDFLLGQIVLILIMFTILLPIMVSPESSHCANRLLDKLFILLRLFSLLVFIGFLSYNMVVIDCFNVSINWINYWQSSKEPFITNASYFNAGVSWLVFGAVSMSYVPQVTLILSTIIETS